MLKLKMITPLILISMACYSQKLSHSKVLGPTKNQGDSLYVILKIKNKVKAGEKINLQFVVHNDHSTPGAFCKWYTPFEPLMSRYLDLRDTNGNQVAYRGPAAKRTMPPPADSYLTINPKDSLSVDIDLLSAYQLEVGKKYTIIYNSSAISGINAVNLVSFAIEK